MLHLGHHHHNRRNEIDMANEGITTIRLHFSTKKLLDKLKQPKETLEKMLIRVLNLNENKTE